MKVQLLPTPPIAVFRFGVGLALALTLALCAAPGRTQPPVSPPAPAAPPVRVLIVGGGPDLKHNQVAIESNVRYVSRLLPVGTVRRTLFADGSPRTPDVLYLGDGDRPVYRTPRIAALDGPTTLLSFQKNLNTLALAPPAEKNSDKSGDKNAAPLLLYFTGHGSPQARGRREPPAFDNNQYDMWNGDELTVQRLATTLGDLPPTEPVTVIMVQCFSGAFGNLLFQNGDPAGPLIDRNLCGFFASAPNRTAAGCTPEINEANYRDFTGYFFAALCGIDRVGNRVSGADYNRDGRIGMNEAFAYTLIHDESIDTPVCTSDTFLRRFVKTPDDSVMATPYRDIKAWASPAQKAALEGLSAFLKLDREDRLQTAYDRFAAGSSDLEAPDYVHTIRFVRLAKSVVLAHTLATTGETALKERFARLVRAESGTPLPPFTGSKAAFAPAARPE